MTATAPARSRSKASQPAPRRATAARPALKAVDEKSILRRVTPSAVVALTVVTGFAFAALAAHISLIDTQHRLDRVRAEIVAEQTRQEDLRQKDSHLQSPDEVIRIARTQLGMVPSARAEIVATKRSTIGVPTTVPATAPITVSPPPAPTH